MRCRENLVYGVRRCQIAVVGRHRVRAQAGDGGRRVRLVRKRRRRQRPTTTATTLATVPISIPPPRTDCDHNQRDDTRGAQLRVPREAQVDNVRANPRGRDQAVRVRQPDRDDGPDRVSRHGVRSGGTASVQKVHRQRVRDEGMPVPGTGAQPDAHRDHGARRAAPGGGGVHGGEELRVQGARAQGVPGAVQPRGLRAAGRVRSDVSRAGVRRGQRVPPAGAGRVRRRFRGRAQGGRGRLPRVRVREQHGGRVRRRRAGVRHQRVPAAAGLADRGTGVRLRRPVADRSSGVLGGLPAAHGARHVDGRTGGVVRAAYGRRDDFRGSTGQGHRVRSSALFEGQRVGRRRLPADVRSRGGRGRSHGRANQLDMVQEKAQAQPVDQRAYIVATENPFDTQKQRRWQRQ